MVDRFCEISVWLHGNFQEGRLVEVEMFGITKIYSGRLDRGWWEQINDAIELDDFKGIKCEEAYLVDVHMEYEDNEPSFTFSNIRIDSAIELPA